MPLTPPGIVGVLTPALAASGMLGQAMPQLASGIAAGVLLWTSTTLQVATVDAGAAGSGVGSLPCTIPPPLLLTGLTTGFTSMGLLGMMAPALIGGLTAGLAAAFAQGVITTAHPTVGTGTGVATFPGPTAVPSMVGGFASVGITGPSGVQMATAIGMGLDIAFGAFTIPVPIVGPSAPVSSSGLGTGKIL